MRDDTHCIEAIKEQVSKGIWHSAKKKAFRDYLAYLGANDKSMRTIYLYANNVHKLGDYLPSKPFEEYTQKDMIDFKTELKKTYAPYSIHNFLLDCQTFLKWHLKMDNGEKPECMKWYRPEKKKIMKKLNPNDILTPEEVRKLVSCAGSVRNKAIVFCLWESGCRIAEFLNTRIKDLNFDDKIVSFYVGKGKTRESEREIFLIHSVPALLEWLNIHEYRNNPDASVFYSQARNGKGHRLWETNVNSVLKRSAAKADITKPVHPHALRKSRATDIAKKRHSSELMKKMFGWADSSTMPSVYARISGQDVKKALLEDAGLVKEEEKDHSLEAIKCPFCGELNSPESPVCRNLSCSRPITEQGILEAREKQRNVMLEAIQGEFRKLREEMLAEMREKIRIQAKQ